MIRLLLVPALFYCSISFAQTDYNLGKSLTAPTFVDIDNDGDLDAFGVETGMTAGNVLYYENTGSKESPEFAKPVKAAFGLKAKSLSALKFVDIDNDGDLDAFGVETGMSAGKAFYHENTGSKESPEFGKAVSYPFGLKSKSLSAFAFVDIDNDGDLDAIGVETGMSAGKVFCHQNTGTKDKPAFEKRAYNPFGLSSKSLSAFSFVDIDNDGDLEAFGIETGMSAGKVFMLEVQK